MQTTYYTIEAKKRKVSGGADFISFTPRNSSNRSRGEVLDFCRCRSRLETKEAWNTLRQAGEGWNGEEERIQSAGPALPQKGKGTRVREYLEVAASLMVILVCLAATAAFLSLI